jgi:hypothetical protein
MRATDELDSKASDPSATVLVSDPTADDEEQERPDDALTARSWTPRFTSTTANYAVGAAGLKRATSTPTSVPTACPVCLAVARAARRAVDRSPGPVRVAWGLA